MNKIDTLLAEIQHHNLLYRQGNPIISDKEYDGLVDTLREIDPNNKWFSQIEPAPIGNGRKVKLPIPMKSLDKVKNIKDLLNWASSVGEDNPTLVIAPKFDGLSLLFDQKSHQAFSRGGVDNEGQDCTAHAKQVSGIMQNTLPNSIHYTYGELVFSRFAWETWFAGHISPYSQEKYKSPRNTVAGFLNRDTVPEELKHTSFVRYGVDAQSLHEFDTYIELYKTLTETYNQECLARVVNVSDLTQELLHNLFQEWSNKYFIDGLVIYVNDLDLWEQLGRKGTSGNPNYAIAYKHPDFTDTFTTSVKEINWSMNKAGALKPVVNIDIVDTGDCAMENPTGYNARFVRDNRIAPGAVVEVTRSGGVIPKILHTTEPASKESICKMWEELKYCPHCGTELTWNETDVELMCSNPNCYGRRLAKIIFFYTILEAENMGEETLSRIFKAGYRTLKDILHITYDELTDIDGIGDGIANVILNTNARILEGVEITKLMHASDCFEGIGQVKAKKILDGLSPEDEFKFVEGQARTDNLNPKDLTGLSKTWQSFFHGIQAFYDFVSENRLVMLPREQPKLPTNTKYQGMKVCFTVVRYKELEAIILDGGGEVVNNVSKKTTHLIVADVNSASTKTNKAKSLGIPIMTIEQFKGH